MADTHGVKVADTEFQTPFGNFKLERYPARRRETLQAWSSADKLLLESVSMLGLAPERALVVNDEHGALTTALQPTELWTDSHLAVTAATANLERNDRKPVPSCWSTSLPGRDAVFAVMRIPKQLAYFEYQLAGLAAILPPDAILLAAGMDKHLSPHTADTIERIFGPAERHPGKRRARVFHAKNIGGGTMPAPSLASYVCEPLGEKLSGLPNVFSRDRLDPGSRLLLAHLGSLRPVASLADLACGNGVLGLVAFHAGLTKRVTFCDESAMAIASARGNRARIFPDDGAAFDFFHGDGLADSNGQPHDLILCNPPFHSGHSVDDFVGKRLVAQAAKQLSAGGQLCLVANRHLDYAPQLRRGFDRSKRLSGNNKFNLWLAEKA